MSIITYSPEHWPYCNPKCSKKDGHWMMSKVDEDFDYHAHDHDLDDKCAECLRNRVEA